MKVSKLAQNDTAEPLWDSVGMHSCDFRPHFDGDLINLFTTAYPEKTRQETKSRFKEIAFKIATWVLENRSQFSSSDRFQIVVAWPRKIRATGRQVIKTGWTFDEIQQLVNSPKLIELRPEWDADVFEPEEAS